MPLSTLVPFALVALIGIVVLYVAYRAELERSAPRNLAKRKAVSLRGPLRFCGSRNQISGI
jgi:hypothetical protein